MVKRDHVWDDHPMDIKQNWINVTIAYIRHPYSEEDWIKFQTLWFKGLNDAQDNYNKFGKPINYDYFRNVLKRLIESIPNESIYWEIKSE